MPLMRGDRKRIARVFCSLLSNAVKFTNQEGHVTIDGQTGPDGSLLFEIADNGIGMEPEQIAHALKPFKQIDNRLARRFEGIGLGLPLAQALVRLHNGEMSISSAPGHGTVVYIAFPPERAVYAVSKTRQGGIV